MALHNEGSTGFRWIPVAEAAELIGRRFHSDWSASDPAMLEYDEDKATDREAWHRAKHVQDMLCRYFGGGIVSAYASTDDGTAITKLPLHWVSDSVFALCLRTGRYRLDFDVWDTCWVDGPELLAALPSEGHPRQKHTYEWEKIVHEAWRFALRRETIPIKAEVVRHLGDWCPANKQAVPDGSHLSRVAKVVVDFLNENKSGWKNLQSGSCEAVDESRE